jgi:hypothetical protein
MRQASNWQQFSVPAGQRSSSLPRAPCSVAHRLRPARTLGLAVPAALPGGGPALGGVAVQPPPGAEHGYRTEPGQGRDERHGGQKVQAAMVPGVCLQHDGTDGMHQGDQHEPLQNALAAPPKLVNSFFVVRPDHHLLPVQKRKRPDRQRSALASDTCCGFLVTSVMWDGAQRWPRGRHETGFKTLSVLHC